MTIDSGGPDYCEIFPLAALLKRCQADGVKYSEAMTITDRFNECPTTLLQGQGEQAATWLLDSTFAAQADGDIDDRFHLVPIAQSDEGACPVYRQAGAASVANGRLFVRLLDEGEIKDFVDELQTLGLEVVHAPAWAPHAAWVAAIDGTPCHALNQLPALQQHDAVAHAEAQLLLERQHR